LVEPHAQHLALARGDEVQERGARQARLDVGKAVFVDADRVAERHHVRLITDLLSKELLNQGSSKEYALDAPPACSASRTAPSLAPEGSGNLRDGGLVVKLLGQFIGGVFDLQRQILKVARDAHRPGAVADVALDLTEDRRLSDICRGLCYPPWQPT
jgi:hypothetical protein